MKVLDLFSGLGGWSAPFLERGHEVISLDNNPRFGATLTQDIFEFFSVEMPWRPDIILASPPCEAFSVLRIGHNWTKEHTPKTDQAVLATRIVEQTRRVIAALEPWYFIIENPTAKLRRLEVVADLERRSVTYCQYGMRWRKPTDLWGGFPPSLQLAARCGYGAPCHVAAPRGSTTGVQGPDSAAQRAKVPYALALAACEAAEVDLAVGRTAERAQLF